MDHEFVKRLLKAFTTLTDIILYKSSVIDNKTSPQPKKKQMLNIDSNIFHSGFVVQYGRVLGVFFCKCAILVLVRCSIPFIYSFKDSSKESVPFASPFSIWHGIEEILICSLYFYFTFNLQNHVIICLVLYCNSKSNNQIYVHITRRSMIKHGARIQIEINS